MYQRFCAYGFGLDYPKGWRISFGKKFSRSNGYVVIESKLNRIFASWGRLQSIPEGYRSPQAHSKASLSKLAKARNPREIHLLARSDLNVNGHNAAFAHFSIDRSGMLLQKANKREIRSIHVHCPDSDRFFILYLSSTEEELVGDSLRIFDRLKESFACHEKRDLIAT